MSPPKPASKARRVSARARVAWVVGGSGTLGQAIAQALLHSGARVVVSSRRTPTRWNGGASGICTLRLDLSDSAAVDRAAKAIVQRLGALDILVNCAAAPVFGDFLELSDADWETVLQTKLLGYMRTMRAVIPTMLQQGRGNIINVSGRGGRQPTPAHLAGCCANAAVNVLTKGVADIYGAHGIRINSIAPGPIDTPRHHEIARSNEKLNSTASKRVPPLGRLGEPEDIANAVLYLSSDAASYITGVTLAVDGGGTATV